MKVTVINGTPTAVVMDGQEVIELLSQHVSKVLCQKYDNPISIVGAHESCNEDEILQIRFVLKQNDIVQEIEL